MLFKKAGAKHFVHLLLRIGLYCIKSFIIYYLLLYPFYSQLSMSALPYFSTILRLISSEPIVFIKKV